MNEEEWEQQPTSLLLSALAFGFFCCIASGMIAAFLYCFCLLIEVIMIAFS
jgi:hypothetical protein